MSNTRIWKYELPVDGGKIVIKEPVVRPLHIAAQRGVPTAWVMVKPDNPYAWSSETEIVAIGTGWPLPHDVMSEYDYWGSCEDGHGFVWHYFARERIKSREDEIAVNYPSGKSRVLSDTELQGIFRDPLMGTLKYDDKVSTLKYVDVSVGISDLDVNYKMADSHCRTAITNTRQ